MLNQMLYNRLCERLGQVRVVKEDQPMVTTPMPPGENGRPEMHIAAWGEGYRIKCPLCQDTKRGLLVSHRYGVYDPVTGSNNLHLCKCFRSGCQSDPDRRKLLADKIFGLLNCNQRQQAPGSPARASLPSEDPKVGSPPDRAL
jgi:hypothetical protein